ncbi:tRNA(Met) cytidine acetyltransferase [Fonticula alba]|uniref:RNA cytidine acetyltransferase n=1 Tax=Fonticula alba TaxID=691883 RepID=A0A058ZCL3_FONAL|nr:tRNA(Met) cytidine acetyltransferase [Fonticula alba]KCV71673.1 tRNA(Met) cytidine acetyltransferase [Fonticula alba]|eukprot:XP_009493251.1 tRNA(Met) cytidine acetyltransferase [Fonticula alba]
MSSNMIRKRVDNRVRTLIENGVHTRQRTLVVMLGDKGRDQVVNLHYMLSKASVRQRPSVLWCYKKELGFSSHRQKRMRQMKKLAQRGLLDPDREDPFELFVTSTNIRYCYYKESHKVLGNTYGMCVLQDFEALTPNILARTIETVEGGGIIVLLLKTMDSLRQLVTMSMDVHSRYRTEAHQDVVARFNERFLLSLSKCSNCMVLDDELNLLPISSHLNGLVAVPAPDSEAHRKLDPELEALQESLADVQPVGALVKGARTVDQAKAILAFTEAVSEKTLRTTVSLTAGRGRGKSASLGLAMAAAVAYGYSNIFVTSPSPENLKTLFEFVFKGFDLLGYEEHIDYDIVQSTNPDFNKAVVRVNIFREHRQTIQYIQPQDAHVLGQAELVVIDEAAAIPLPLVRALMGPYLVFLASTINGYEGTGRSLSLKLLQQLREQSVSAKADTAASTAQLATSRSLREIKLEEPIRYAAGDPIEKWLNDILCLDCTSVPRLSTGCPHPSECELYFVERDTLFSFHPAAESFLQRLVALYVASHYKNSPNDLQLLSDAPAHNIFVLLAPVDPGSGDLPEILAVVQVALEGAISRESMAHSLARGERLSGDLIPWTIAQQFQESDFGSMSGARVVRIATHPDYQNMGYGSRALNLLREYYEGKFPDMSSTVSQKPTSRTSLADEISSSDTLQTEVIRPRKNLPPLLRKLTERTPERIHYLGVSFGLTAQLHKFWKRATFVPVYLRQTPNDLTGEHTCIMLSQLNRADPITSLSNSWLSEFWTDFSRRFTTLLSYQFRNFSPALAMDLLNNTHVSKVLATSSAGVPLPNTGRLCREQMLAVLSPYDLKRLDAYSRNLVDYHMILDLVPAMTMHLFTGQLAAEAPASEAGPAPPAAVNLSPVQSAVMLALGLQRKSVEQLEKDLSLSVSQVLALFNKSVRKIAKYYADLNAQAYESTMPRLAAVTSAGDLGTGAAGTGPRDASKSAAWSAVGQSLTDDLTDAAREELRAEQRRVFKSMDVSKFALPQDEEAWAASLAEGASALVDGASLSVANPDSVRARRLKGSGAEADAGATGAAPSPAAGAKKRKASSTGAGDGKKKSRK